MNDNEARCDDMDFLVPHFQDRLRVVLQELEGLYVRGQVGCQFRVFETYRSPQRQLQLMRMGKSKALPWQSAHQFGVAADVVPWIIDPANTKGGRWTWEPADRQAFSYLRGAALKAGLDCPIAWDRAHVQHSGMLAQARMALGM